MFGRSIVGNGIGNITSKPPAPPSVFEPVAIMSKESTTSKIGDTECIEYLRDRKNSLNKFIITLSSIFSTANTLFSGKTSAEQLGKSHKLLLSQIIALDDDIRLEETAIDLLLQERYTAGGRRKSNRRRTKRNRRY